MIEKCTIVIKILLYRLKWINNHINTYIPCTYPTKLDIIIILYLPINCCWLNISVNNSFDRRRRRERESFRHQSKGSESCVLCDLFVDGRTTVYRLLHPIQGRNNHVFFVTSNILSFPHSYKIENIFIQSSKI